MGICNQKISIQRARKRFGKSDFKDLKYQSGFSSKFFKDAMANPEKRQRIIQARHGVS